MNRVLMALKDLWIDSNFTAGEEQLLKEIPEILEALARSPPTTPPQKPKGAGKSSAQTKKKKEESLVASNS